MKNPIAKILIADDEESIRLVLSRSLEKANYEAISSQDGNEALNLLTTQKFDVALLDIRMPGLPGLEILSRRNEFAGAPPVVIMTAQDTLDNAVTSTKNGAFDYLTKPFNLGEVLVIVRRAVENARLQAQFTSRENAATPSLVGKSRAMTEIFKTVGRLADQDITVLVTGESGTGKEIIARAIHFSGNRAEKSFVALNCSAIPENLLESELFGHKKGSFTGADADRTGTLERAHGGTVFLDEIGDMPANLQVKLLRFLQDKTIQRVGDASATTVDARIIAATHRDLREEIRAGRFREDLYFRLNVVPLYVPPLRERREDIRPLAEHFIVKYGAQMIQAKRLAPDTMVLLENHDWPGNVRELENAVKRLLALARGAVITSEEASLILDHENSSTASVENLFETAVRALLAQLPESEWANLYEKCLVLLEEPLFRAVLEKSEGNQSKAAEILGLNRNTLREKMNPRSDKK